MVGRVDLSNGFEVYLDGRLVANPYPTKATAELLLILAASAPRPVHRANLAARVYPSLDQGRSANALRQTLFRLRKWLGADLVIARKGLIGLAGEWHVEPAVAEPSTVGAAEMEPPPGRVGFSPAPPGLANPSALYQLVMSLATEDADVAREILVSASTVLESCRFTQVQEMFRACKPVRSTCPRASEYYVLRSQQNIRSCQLANGVKDAETAYRIARHNNRRTLLAQCLSNCLFACLEAARMEESTFWLQRLHDFQSVTSTRLLTINAEFAYHWNSGNIEQAVEAMVRGVAQMHTATRRSLLHFFSNASVFCAEIGDPGQAIQFLDSAKRLVMPTLDVLYSLTILFAESEIALARGDMGTALETCSKALDLADELEFPATRLYVLSQLARVHSRLGNAEKAAQAWREKEQMRKRSGGGLTPRLEGQKAAALGRARLA